MSILTNSALQCAARYNNAFLLGVVAGVNDLTDDDLSAQIRYMYAFAVGLAPFNLGGDDVPGRNPHRGYDLEARKGNDVELDQSIRKNYRRLTGQEVEEEAPVATRAAKPLPKKAVRKEVSKQDQLKQMTKRWSESISRIKSRY